MIGRRELIKGALALVAAPAIVRFDSIMPVKLFEPVLSYAGWGQNSRGEWVHTAIVGDMSYINGLVADIDRVVAVGYPIAASADVAVWERALAPLEVAALAEGARPSVFWRKLKSWHPLDAKDWHPLYAATDR